MKKRQIVKISEHNILLTQRFWWEIYKKGWIKHSDFWNRKLWKKQL